MIIDGKKIASEVLTSLKKEIANSHLQPKLGIILVGENPASTVYVNQKKKRGEEIGIEVTVFKFPTEVTESELEFAINQLNSDPTITGMIIQLPLPDHLNKEKLLNEIDKQKDVDGLGTASPFKPATALGIMELLKRSGVGIANKKVVVMGASELVGKPVARLLTEAGGLVTIVDINTPNREPIIKQAEILIVAIGQPQSVKKDMVKEGVVVVDVGITRTKDGLVGDVDFDGVLSVASLITPVPGGVGPMTVAMLLRNVVEASR